MLLHTLAGIAWDPQIRGFLAFGVGVVVLIGSVYLLLVTNLGLRLGFMIAAAAIFGWMTIMGGIWWAYGNIGMLGEVNRWEVQEIVYPGLENAAPRRGPYPRHDLVFPIPKRSADLTDEELSQGPRRPRSRPSRVAPATRVEPQLRRGQGDRRCLLRGPIPTSSLGIDTADDYVSVYSFERGGKERLPENPSRIDRLVKKFKTTFIQLKHPPRSRRDPGAAGRQAGGRARAASAHAHRRSGQAGGLRDHAARPRRCAVPRRHAHDLLRASCSPCCACSSTVAIERVAAARSMVPATTGT